MPETCQLVLNESGPQRLLRALDKHVLVDLEVDENNGHVKLLVVHKLERLIAFLI